MHKMTWAVQTTAWCTAIQVAFLVGFDIKQGVVVIIDVDIMLLLLVSLAY